MPNSPVELSPEAKALKVGIYKHYKGREFQVLGVALHSETKEELVMHKAVGEELVWVRPLNMFTDSVDVNNQMTPRFVFVRAM